MLPIKCLKTSILNSEKDKQYDGRKKIHTLDVNSGLIYTYIPGFVLSTLFVIYQPLYCLKQILKLRLSAAMFVVCFDNLQYQTKIGLQQYYYDVFTMTISILKSPEEDTRGLPDHESTTWSQIFCLIFSDEITNFAKMTRSSE